MRGCISKRKNGTYAYTIEIGKHPETGKRRQKMKAGFATRKEAEQALAKALADLGRGSYIEETKQSVQEYFLDFFEQKRQHLRPGTTATYKWLIFHHIIPNLGTILMLRLTPSHLVKLYDRLRKEKKLSPQTVNHVHMLLYDGLATAVRHEILSRNVAALVNPPKIPKPQTNVWTEKELMQFLEHAKPSRYYLIVLLAATCGLRRGEALGLRWEDVDFRKKTITISQSYSRGEREYAFQEPKTRAGNRTIALPEITLQTLKRQKAVQAQERLAAGGQYVNHGLVTQDKQGYPVNPNSLYKHWTRMLQKSGLPKIRFHDLRHTHASLLLKQNVHPKIVAERMGHSSVGITLDRYSHTYGVDYGAANEIDIVLQL